MENQRVTNENPTEKWLEKAALWYSQNRHVLARSFVPVLREKFDLTALQAIEAAKLAGDRHG